MSLFPKLLPSPILVSRTLAALWFARDDRVSVLKALPASVWAWVKVLLFTTGLKGLLPRYSPRTTPTLLLQCYHSHRTLSCPNFSVTPPRSAHLFSTVDNR